MANNVVQWHKKRRSVWIKAFFLITFILVTGCVFLVVAMIQNKGKRSDYVKPDKLFEDYIGFLKKREYGNMYEMLDEDSKMHITKEEFVERHRSIYEGVEANQIEATIRRVKDEGDGGVIVNYTISMQTVAGELGFDHQANFQLAEGTGYRLAWDHDMIFPNLEETDKVVVSKSEAKRGSVFDRNGITLAGQGTASMVGLVPGKMSDDGKESVQKVSKLLNVSAKDIREKLNASWVKEDSFVPIKTLKKVNELDLLTNDPDEEVVENDRLQKELLNVPGVQMKDVDIRTYPLREIASHITGYVQNVTEDELKELGGMGYDSDSVIGKSGLEKAYEDRLRGKDGCEVRIVTKDGEDKQLLALRMKKDGEDVKLTIDSELQRALYERFKGDPGCSVAMNPKTGEVLALVSTPSFDPNAFVLGMSGEEWKELSENEEKPMWSRFSATWCPGSSLKPVIAAMGIATNNLDPNKDYGKEGHSWQKDESWGGYYVTTLQEYEDVRLENALIYSDNIFFAKTALRIGTETFMEWMNRLGFGESVPFDLRMTNSQYSNSGTIESEIQLADSGYGQGQVLVNPLHLASLYSAFVNDGNMVTPYIQEREQGQVEYWKEKAFPKNVASVVREALVQVVENPKGTASICRMDGIRLAGKTGTAEVKATKENETGTEVGWLSILTTEAGTEDSILIVSMVEDVKEHGGSSYVVKKDKKVLDWYFSNGRS